jgi:hypothetical protein
MAIERKIVTVSVDRTSTDPGFNYEAALEAAIETALPAASGWAIVYPDKRGGTGANKDVYTIWAERTV